MSPPPLERSDYAALDDGIYLNQASLGLLGRPAVDAMHRFLDEVARHGNRFMSDADETSYGDALRQRAAELLHTDRDRIAIASGASEVLGQVPLLAPPPDGGAVVAVATDFPAVTRPWLRLAELGRCRMHWVDDDPQRDLTDDIIEAIDRTTTHVVVASVQYATGSRVDIPRLCGATKDAGARLVVDATQEAGALEIDTDSWAAADVVVSSGYKWLGGHGGVALAVVERSLLEQAPPLPGWMGAADPFDFDATRLSFAEDARRYTQSTMSYVSMAGLTASLEALLSVGIGAIQAHAAGLARRLCDALAPNGWRPFRALDDPSASPHIISLGRGGGDLDHTIRSLRESGVVCSSRGGRVRVSLAPYNDDSDLEALVSALR